MKDGELKLNRLFKAARSATQSGTTERISDHLKARVLAHWRTERARESSWMSLATLFQRALACATVAMLVCLVWSYVGAGASELTLEPPSEEMLASYELPDDLLP